MHSLWSEGGISLDLHARCTCGGGNGGFFEMTQRERWQKIAAEISKLVSSTREAQVQRFPGLDLMK